MLYFVVFTLFLLSLIVGAIGMYCYLKISELREKEKHLSTAPAPVPSPYMQWQAPTREQFSATKLTVNEDIQNGNELNSFSMTAKKEVITRPMRPSAIKANSIHPVSNNIEPNVVLDPSIYQTNAQDHAPTQSIVPMPPTSTIAIRPPEIKQVSTLGYVAPVDLKPAQKRVSTKPYGAAPKKAPAVINAASSSDDSWAT